MADKDRENYREAGDDDQQRFVFDQTPVLLTPPPGLVAPLPQGPEGDLVGGFAGAGTVPALLEGEWTTRRTKGDRFAVTGFNAFLTIPQARVRLDRKQRFTAVIEAVIPLALTELDPPKSLEKAFGPVNQGSLDAKQRLVHSCIAMKAFFGEALGRPLEAAHLLLRTTGIADRGGDLRMAASGLILAGPLQGTILACAGFRFRQEGPEPPVMRQEGEDCAVTITPRVSGDTNDGEAYSDFTKFDGDGDGTGEIEFQPDGPTDADELGPVKGLYVFPDGRLGIGYFVKTETEITVEAPCKIVFVDRRMRTLAGHNLNRAHGWEPDHIVDPGAPDAERKLRDSPSVTVISDQRWLVTDAPGGAGSPKRNKRYKKEFELIVTIERADGTRFQRRESFVAELRTNTSGNIRTD